MKLGVRSKLFLVSVLLIAIAVGVAGFVLVGDLRSQLETRIENELERHARTAAVVLAKNGSVPELATALGEASGVRMTVIADDGTVLGDSSVPDSGLSALANHASRPEILEAQAKGRGRARRYSTTLSTDMLYVAVVAKNGTTVRAARPLREVEAAVSTLRRRLGLAALIGLFLAVLMSALASHWVTRVIRELASRARRIAGVADKNPATDEIGHLAGSLDLLSNQIENTVSTLAEEREQFATVLESMNEGVIAIDDDQQITLINSAAVAVLDLSEDPKGRSFLETIRAPAVVEMLAELRRAKSKSLELELELPGGKRLLTRATRAASGRGSVIVIHDITEMHRLETVRRDFVANVSHELRTPVSVISANAETLLDSDSTSGPIEKLVDAIHRNSIRMGRLVADLLDLSKLEAGRYELETEALNVEPIAKAVVAAVADKADEKKMNIVVAVDEGVSVRADRAALDQVLVNLLENAIKYTPSEGTVILRAKSMGTQTRIEVEDDGPGIAPAQRTRVFERFYRLDPGRDRKSGGTGLGLAIVRHLVENMSGTVGVSNATANGSLFWLELPASAD